MSKKIHVTTTVNGEPAEFLCEPRQSLLEVLRDTLRLTGAKEGCNNGNCGACTVLLTACRSIAASCWPSRPKGPRSRPSKASRSQGHLHPLQQCFLEGAALQCGICTPGFLVAAKALLDKNPEPQRARDPLQPGQQPLPLHRLRQDRAGRPGRGDRPASVTGAKYDPHGRPRIPRWPTPTTSTSARRNTRSSAAARPARRGGQGHREGGLHGRRHAAEHGARQDRPQPARPRPDQVDRR